MSASPFGGEGFGDDTVFLETDASPTVTLTTFGFKNGASVGIVGASGHVYATPIPEPASLLELGGLVVLTRRRRVRHA